MQPTSDSLLLSAYSDLHLSGLSPNGSLLRATRPWTSTLPPLPDSSTTLLQLGGPPHFSADAAVFPEPLPPSPTTPNIHPLWCLLQGLNTIDGLPADCSWEQLHTTLTASLQTAITFIEALHSHLQHFGLQALKPPPHRLPLNDGILDAYWIDPSTQALLIFRLNLTYPVFALKVSYALHYPNPNSYLNQRSTTVYLRDYYDLSHPELTHTLGPAKQEYLLSLVSC